VFNKLCLIHTPKEEQLRLFQKAEVVIVPCNDFALIVLVDLRALLAIDSVTALNSPAL
jgi:hypothetical protein